MRVTASGFVSGKGLAVLDPTITAWRLTATPALDLNLAAMEPTTLAESGLTFTTAPGVKVKNVRYWPERLSTDALEALIQ
jgi:hypothetical protein